LDRLDLQIEVPSLTPEILHKSESGTDSKKMAETVARARHQQFMRTRETGFRLNAHLSSEQVRKFCKISATAVDYLERCMRRYPLSARGYTRILKLARTLADLDATKDILLAHIEKAAMFRALDRIQS
jgi:magnesium chelatase family protein